MRILLIISMLLFVGCTSAPLKNQHVYHPRLASHSCYSSEGTVFVIMNTGKHNGQPTYNVYVISRSGVKTYNWAYSEKFDKFNADTSKKVRCQ